MAVSKSIPAARRLFPDPVAEGVRYYKKTGLLPINHGMVVKRALAERHPWIVLNVLKAFERANDIGHTLAGGADGFADWHRTLKRKALAYGILEIASGSRTDVNAVPAIG